MPEGHKTHYLANAHRDLLRGQPLRVSSPQGRFDGDARKIDGCRLSEVTAIGKQLFYAFENGLHWQVHLGRYGSFKQHTNPAPQPVGQVRARLSGQRTTLDLSGPTTCRVVDTATRDGVVAAIGPDPLGGGKAGIVWERFQQKRGPVGAVLLDQSVVAGIGNILRAEILYEIGMDPRRPAHSLAREEFDQLWKATTRMMRKALRYGRIISVSHHEVSGRLTDLRGNARFRVYGREQCPVCGVKIVKKSIGGRPLYYCPTCQIDPD
jgi:endonuclease-8